MKKLVLVCGPAGIGKSSFCKKYISEHPDENIFIVSIWDGKDCKRKYFNAKTSTVKDCNYDVIKFSPNKPNGYAFNTITDMIDIIDKIKCDD